MKTQTFQLKKRLTKEEVDVKVKFCLNTRSHSRNLPKQKKRLKLGNLKIRNYVIKEQVKCMNVAKHSMPTLDTQC